MSNKERIDRAAEAFGYYRDRIGDPDLVFAKGAKTEREYVIARLEACLEGWSDSGACNRIHSLLQELRGE